ncbi:hypothetical protein Nepgr_024245 [Nepenthes gracilis]|uniref:Uncharacterized protein n=1 Tax=Nepenthes gracilis TaxID=150966 RepID=A0AAD3T4A5_NEPGR|nr:hypothetical protein Nepgr_024245 [Nepenthes gracilis]
MIQTSSWLRTRRARILFLCLCSPVIFPFLCLFVPLFCFAHLCLCLCLRGRGCCKRTLEFCGEDVHGGRLRRCEEGRQGIGGNREEEAEEEEEMALLLLQRYLEDQMDIVGSAVYDCGDGNDFDDSENDGLNCGDDDDDDDDEDDDNYGDCCDYLEIKSPLLSRVHTS